MTSDREPWGDSPNHDPLGAADGRLLREWDRVADSLQLSSRQAEVARKLMTNATEATIARDLEISPHTVHTHIRQLHRKLDVHSRVELLLRLANELIALSAAQTPPERPSTD